MYLLLYGSEHEAALRAAKRLGANQVALAKARIAAYKKASNTRALLDAVPRELHGRCRLPVQQYPAAPPRREIRRGSPTDDERAQGPGPPVQSDEWWIERRLLSRKMLDIGERRTAYLIAPTQPFRRATSTRPSRNSPRAGLRCAS